MAITTAKKLAAYISKFYTNNTGKEITPVRLQKTLYFCFAYWGGFVRKGKKYQDENRIEVDVNNLDEILFDDIIEAWVYGPVVPDVYREKNIDEYYDKDIFEGNELAKEIIDGVIEDTLEIRDFKLVDISHKDKCWINKFIYEECYHNNEMDKESIIAEYAIYK